MKHRYQPPAETRQLPLHQFAGVTVTGVFFQKYKYDYPKLEMMYSGQLY